MGGRKQILETPFVHQSIRALGFTTILKVKKKREEALKPTKLAPPLCICNRLEGNSNP